MNKKDVYDQGYNTGYDIASSNIYTELNSENFSQEKFDEFIDSPIFGDEFIGNIVIDSIPVEQFKIHQIRKILKIYWIRS
jgi:hypothetical protein